MDDHVFADIEQAIEAGGSGAAFDLLIETFRAEKKYPLLFEARLMKKRLDLGLPLIDRRASADLPEDTQRAYEAAMVEAAREVGGLFLAGGDVVRAWPYFRAVGEHGPVAEALERLEPGESLDAFIEIALHERVHPRRGFELILAHYGICRAITFFDQYPDRKTRPECLQLLVRTLHSDLVEALHRAIARVEGRAPETRRVPDLIAGREWLFGEYDYYVDTSHLVSILRFSLELEDRECLALGLEMAAYGQRLSPHFHYRCDAPFENVYEDHATYLRALLGEDEDAAVAHFRKKLAQYDLAETGSGPAQTLVMLLARLGRYHEAVEVSLEHLRDQEPGQLACSSVCELCEMAGDAALLKRLARERNDLLSYLAGALTGAGAAVRSA